MPTRPAPAPLSYVNPIPPDSWLHEPVGRALSIAAQLTRLGLPWERVGLELGELHAGIDFSLRSSGGPVHQLESVMVVTLTSDRGDHLALCAELVRLGAQVDGRRYALYGPQDGGRSRKVGGVEVRAYAPADFLTESRAPAAGAA